MSALLNIETIYREERERWFREEAPRKSIREYIADSVPYWIILVALVLFGLSAPHTADVFDKLTPGWGWIAPVGVEFGLLYAAFQRHLAKTHGKSLPWTLWTLEILLFLTAMLVNGAGSFTSVIVVSGLESLSSAAIIEQFGHLPATTQAALLMAILSAFIIPIGALVAGEGLAALALEQQVKTDFSEAKWSEVEPTIIYRAVFVRYMQQGLSERDARQRAVAEVKGYLGKGNLSAVRPLFVVSEQHGHRTNGQIKSHVRAFLDENPKLERLSINQVLAELREAGIQVGRTTVAGVLQERRMAQSLHTPLPISKENNQ